MYLEVRKMAEKKGDIYVYADDDDWTKRMRTCPICKKRFLPAPQHAWKIGNQRDFVDTDDVGKDGKLVCTYTCMRVWEKNRDAKEAEQRKQKRKKFEEQGYGYTPKY
jgi:hypothetical protein